jgi:hypothetical protein
MHFLNVYKCSENCSVLLRAIIIYYFFFQRVLSVTNSNRINFVRMYKYVYVVRNTERSKNLHSLKSIPIFQTNNDTNTRSNVFLVNYHTRPFHINITISSNRTRTVNNNNTYCVFHSTASAFPRPRVSHNCSRWCTLCGAHIILHHYQ